MRVVISGYKLSRQPGAGQWECSLPLLQHQTFNKHSKILKSLYEALFLVLYVLHLTVESLDSLSVIRNTLLEVIMEDKSITQYGRKLFSMFKVEKSVPIFFLEERFFFFEEDDGFYEDSVLFWFVHLHVSDRKND